MNQSQRGDNLAELTSGSAACCADDVTLAPVLLRPAGCLCPIRTSILLRDKRQRSHDASLHRTRPQNTQVQHSSVCMCMCVCACWTSCLSLLHQASLSLFITYTHTHTNSTHPIITTPSSSRAAAFRTCSGILQSSGTQHASLHPLAAAPPPSPPEKTLLPPLSLNFLHLHPTTITITITPPSTKAQPYLPAPSLCPPSPGSVRSGPGAAVRPRPGPGGSARPLGQDVISDQADRSAGGGRRGGGEARSAARLFSEFSSFFFVAFFSSCGRSGTRLHLSCDRAPLSHSLPLSLSSRRVAAAHVTSPAGSLR